MKKEYRNKIIGSILLIIGIMLFALLDGYFGFTAR